MCAISSSAMGQMIIAHRGASYDAPENTIAAYKLAIEQGADGFEGDFWVTANGQILDLHDKDTKRVGGKKLAVTSAPFKQLRALDVGTWKAPKWHAERIPTLEEVFDVVPAGKKFFIELKSGPEIAGPLAKAIAASRVPPDQMVIISFHADAIAACKKEMPHIKMLWLSGMKKKKDGTPPPTVDEVVATVKRIHADGINVEAVPEYFDAKFIDQLKEKGVTEFSVWTVDDPKVAKFYADLGARAITTNRPGWLREQMKK